ncbi:MAG: efflux RND transporter periplasmic adaptor subunit [Xanthomonadales bacterium]|nr:efflux RND transporter periplasmic adaptor subunit [Xanthomonadales bacterium]
MNWKKTLITCVAILALAAVVMVVIRMTEPVAQRSSASKRTAMLVELTRGESGTFQPEIKVPGTVRAEQEIVLSPRVGGEIISVSESFTPGGFVDKGAVLLQIDPSDYEVTLLQRTSELHQATADLELELGRQGLALKDYKELEGTISPEYKPLVLREPQLNIARSRVEAAEAAVRQAELDLERTRIRAPFGAHIINREANVGSQVSPGDALGKLVGIEHYWVEAAVPVSKLQWIDFSTGPEAEQSNVRIRNRAAWPEGVFRQGKVHRLIGALENQTRLARVLLTVADPLSHEPESAGLPPLMVGSFVEARIAGKPINDVIRIDRDYIRQDDSIWINEGGVLQIRDVEIVFRDDEFAYIRTGLVAEDQVITTNLATVFEGAALRVAKDAE